MSRLATVNQETPGPIMKAGAIDIGRAVQDAASGAIPPSAIEAVERMLAMQERVQAREAKQSFVEAFGRVREKLKTINAIKPVPGSGNTVRWYYAPLEDLQDEVEPILRNEGLEITFDSRREGPNANIVIGICKIMHLPTGHTETAQVGVDAKDCQGGDLGAMKKAKRGALTALLGIRTRHDEDARMLGDVVNLDQIAELKRRLKATGRDARRFLARGGVVVPPDVAVDDSHWKQIRQGKLGGLHDDLTRAEQAAKAPANPQIDAPSAHGQDNQTLESDLNQAAEEATNAIPASTRIKWLNENYTTYESAIDEALQKNNVSSLTALAALNSPATNRNVLFCVQKRILAKK